METEYKFNIGDSINYKGKKYTIIDRFNFDKVNYYHFKDKGFNILYAEEKEIFVDKKLTTYEFNIGDKVLLKSVSTPLYIYKREKMWDTNRNYYCANTIEASPNPKGMSYLCIEEKDLELYQETNKTMTQKAFTTRTITFSSGDELKLSQAQNNNNLISFSFKVNNRPLYLELTSDDCLELTRQLDSYVEEVEENIEMKDVDNLLNKTEQ